MAGDWLTLLTVIAFVLWATLPSGVVPFWVVWLAIIWPLPLAGLINWLGRDGGRRRASLSEAPAEYLRTEYRGTQHRDSRPELISRWPG